MLRIRVNVAQTAILALAGLAVIAPPQAAYAGNEFKSPSSGYMYDGYLKAVRPIVGFLGSAYLGTKVAECDWASISPRGNAAWLTQENRLKFLPDLAAGVPAELAGEWPAPQAAIWSVDGKATVLATPGSLVFVSIDGNQVPQAQHTLQLETGTTVRLIGASEDLQSVYYAITSGPDQLWQVAVWERGDESRVLGTAADPIAAVSIASTGSIYVADAGTKRILRFSQSEGSESETALDEAQGIDQPVGLMVSGDRLLVLDKSSHTVRGFDLATRELTWEAGLDEEPSTPAPLGSGRYLLNQRTRKQQSVLVLDISGEPKVVFVPAGE